MESLIIIEDHAQIRDMLVRTFSEEYQVSAAPNGAEGLRRCREQKPQYVILDLRMPRMNGLEVLRHLSRELPQTRVIIFSAYEVTDSVEATLGQGAMGFVEKTAGLRELKEGVRALSRNQRYLSPAVARHVLSRETARKRELVS
jgi:DNA-binding NarL/FixJ family response regulator